MNVRRLIRPLAAWASFLAAAPFALSAQAVAVHHPGGASHAFLVIRSEEKAVLGYGELLQLADKGRITVRLTLRFHDGSLDDETTIYTQRDVFHLISDHHIQKGPFFDKPVDALVEENGNVTIRTAEKDGTPKVEQSHIDLPPDVSNGFVGTLLLNVSPTVEPFKVGMVATTGKGRLIALSISPAGQESFSPIAGVRREATVFRIHPELGGVEGVVAPIMGKQPKDIFVWVLEGEVPGLVREIGQLAEGGPIVSLEPAGASYPPAAAVKK